MSIKIQDGSEGHRLTLIHVDYLDLESFVIINTDVALMNLRHRIKKSLAVVDLLIAGTSKILVRVRGHPGDFYPELPFL